MKITITPRALSGRIPAIESKSHVHRLLICAALGDNETFLPCRVVSEDIEATARCVGALGAGVRAADGGLYIDPINSGLRSGGLRPGGLTPDCSAPDGAYRPSLLDCGESGSTYRFLVPLAAALGRPARFKLSGRLPGRPMGELWSVLEKHAVSVGGKGGGLVGLRGKLSPGVYEIPGGVSSQFISGLLLALPLLASDSALVVTGELQSAGYVDLTLSVLREFSVKITPTPTGFIVPGGQKYLTPPSLAPEGDWSNAAFWLSAAALGGEGVTLTGLRHVSAQGDRAICDILARFGAGVSLDGGSVTVRPGRLRGVTLDAGPVPDLIPALAVVAAAAEGTTTIVNAGRLRLKESDRISSVISTLTSLGGRAEADGDTIIIYGSGGSGLAGGTGLPGRTGLSGGTVDSFGDHRIAMMAAAASIVCRDEVVINGAEAVGKSYPCFFDDFTALGGLFRTGE